MTEPDMRHGQMECFVFGPVGDASGMPKLARRGFIMPSMGGPEPRCPRWLSHKLVDGPVGPWRNARPHTGNQERKQRHMWSSRMAAHQQAIQRGF